MSPGNALVVAVAVAGLQSCSMHSPRVPVPSVDVEGCPAVLLTRTGGFGYESQSGVIAAVWESGVIVRAKSPKRPWASHEVGRLNHADLTGLIEKLNTTSTWNSPTGEVAVDNPDDVLTLRRAGELRTWAETPGLTSTVTVADFRTKLLAMSVEHRSRAAGGVGDLWKCMH